MIKVSLSIFCLSLYPAVLPFTFQGEKLKFRPVYLFILFPKIFYFPQEFSLCYFFPSAFQIFLAFHWSYLASSCHVCLFFLIQIMCVMTVVCRKEGFYLDIFSPDSFAFRNSNFLNHSRTERDFIHLKDRKMQVLLPK